MFEQQVVVLDRQMICHILSAFMCFLSRFMTARQVQINLSVKLEGKAKSNPKQLWLRACKFSLNATSLRDKKETADDRGRLYPDYRFSVFVSKVPLLFLKATEGLGVNLT